MRPTWRRLARTAAFVALVFFILYVDPQREGWEIRDGLSVRVLVFAAAFGYITWPAWEAPAVQRRWKSSGDRIRKTALWMIGGGVAVLAADALLTGGIDLDDVLQVGISTGAVFAYVILMARLAGTGRRDQPRCEGVLTSVLPHARSHVKKF